MEKNQTNAAYVTMHLIRPAIWKHTWKCTVGKRKWSATYVTLHPHGQPVWGDIWKCIVEKSRTNATNVTMHPHRPEIWRNTLNCTVPESLTNEIFGNILSILFCLFSFRCNEKNINFFADVLHNAKHRANDASNIKWCSSPTPTL